MDEQILYYCQDDLYMAFLFDRKDESYRKYEWGPVLSSKIRNQQQIKKITSGDEYEMVDEFLVLYNSNKIDFYSGKSRNNSQMIQTKQFEIENEEIEDLQAGSLSFLILTKSGKVYSFADSKRRYDYEDIPFQDPENSTYDKIRIVPFFQKNNLFVKSIVMNAYSNYYLCKNGELYANGFNENCEIGEDPNTHYQLPINIAKNVKKVFSGKKSRNLFYLTQNKELYGRGLNNYGQLSIGSKKLQNVPKKIDVTNLDGKEILDIKSCYEHTILITKSGESFSCGCGDNNGIGEDKLIFTEIPHLKNKVIIKIHGCSQINFFITQENELYALNLYKLFFQNSRNLNKNGNETNNETDYFKFPRKINLPQFFENNLIPFQLNCGFNAVFLYPDNRTDSLNDDFKQLFKSKKYCDSKLIIISNEIEIEIPIHKLIIELRTGLKIEKIQSIINEKKINKKDIFIFLKWTYYDKFEYSKQNQLLQIFNSFELSFPPQNDLKEDLLKLYNDNNSKDFRILVKNVDVVNNGKIKDNIDVEDDDEEDILKFKQILVHKLILLTRTGLFRDMFDNLNEKENNINQINDYSQKSIESLQILIKYFYTNKLDLLDFGNDNKKIDNELLYDELHDSVEYYQLNRNSYFHYQLNQMVKGN
ncbi:btk-binding protein-related [Anaeramoeba flamelloides]|uniref:Btk-binding protein-related n=1 Tax=Anaeramoeba flamelloides TaxID=1746091 RepID=A0AAV7ZLY7_9EUKA|nr:btk-binding protein-related [Anaeramoeba flamelloides]